MIKDDIFYGNLLGLLKTGKWNINAAESIVLIKVIQELERRLIPVAPIFKQEPIKKEKKK